MKIFNSVAETFFDLNGKKIIWYKTDRNNLLNQHHEHDEYNNTDEIRECLKNPDQINKDRNNKKRRLIYYRDKGNHFIKWVKVVIKIPKNWDDYADNKLAVLITIFYLDKINNNEEKIWP